MTQPRLPRPPRLDVLIYAHDGRGLGHVSRSAAIGMALRRLYPELRVCLMTGCRQTQEMISPAPLDWLKLPSYETTVVDGVSRGVRGVSNFSDQELGLIRKEQIEQLFSLYRPRLFLADHTPQGKHRELVPSLSALSSRDETVCVLGVRGVVGTVSQTRLPLVQELFRNHFSKLLWYGDSNVLGRDHPDMLSRRFDTDVVECGYVSRLAELNRLFLDDPANPVKGQTLACTVSIPWFGEYSNLLAANLSAAIQRLGPGFGMFRLYIGDIGDIGEGSGYASIQHLNDLEWCTVEPFGSSYARSLSRSRSAIIFGGYNSLVDVLALEIPALVVQRNMRDQEQQDHLEALMATGRTHLSVIDEKTSSAEDIYRGLLDILEPDPPISFSRAVSLDGAAQAAHVLAALL